MISRKDYAYGCWGDHVWEHRESEFLDDPDADDIIEIACSKAQDVADRQESYQSFLQTDYWQQARSLAIQRANGRCEACGCLSTRLEVHHKRYPKRGTEHLNQHLLEALCRSCHEQSH
jgi:5-methylcytosine-specific restriction endonuclease McrA